MKKKTITFIAPFAYPLLTIPKREGAGGAERQFFLFGNGLIKHGWKVSFITQKPPCPNEKYKVVLPVYFASFSYMGGKKINIICDWINLFFAMKKANSKFYVVKTPGHLLFPMKLFCKILKSKLIFWAQMEYDAYPAKRPIPKLPGKLQDLGTIMSDFIIGQNLHQIQGFQLNYNRKANLIRNIIGDLSVIKLNYNNASNKKTDVLWVGNSLPKKQYEIVVELALRMPEINFTVAMNLAEPKRYNNAKKAFQSLKNVDFLGSVPQDLMEKWYSNTKIFLNTSTQEGFPNTFLQAWQNGVPVVSLYVDPDNLIKKYNLGKVGLSNLVTDNKDKFKLSAEVIRLLLLNLLKDNDLRTEMGVNAKKYVQKYHSEAAVIPEIINLLN